MVKLAKRKKNEKTGRNQVTWHTPKLLNGFNYKSKGDDNGRRRSWGAFPGLQHFGGRGVCWNFRMGTKKINKEVNYLHGLAQTKQQVG